MGRDFVYDLRKNLQIGTNILNNLQGSYETWLNGVSIRKDLFYEGQLKD